jgi:Zn ribbon nucleic-acid-binding protein
MTILDNIRKRYVVQAKCSNCSEVQEVSVPKGMTIENFFKDGDGKCSSCGCATLIKFEAQRKSDPKQPKVKWI